MRNLDLTTLRLFVAVCETGSLRTAGERASMVGSAISKRLAQLEGILGTRLLVRRKHGMTPTPAGQTLLEHARAVMARMEQIERDMTGYAEGVSGLVQVVCTSSVLGSALADDLADFLRMEAHAQIQVSMEEHASRGVVQSVRDGLASLGLCWDATDLTGLESRPYRVDHLAMVMHASHPLAQHRALRFEQALDYQQVGLPATTELQLLLRRVAADHGKTLVNRIVVANFDAALRVVRADLAISVVPLELVRQVAAVTSSLVAVPLEDEWARRQFVLCFRSAAALPPATGLLVAHLVAAAARP